MGSEPARLTPRPVLLDTCIAIWLMQGDPIAPAARSAIEAALTARAGIFVSPITAWEIATLVSRRRLALTMPVETWFAALLALPGMRLAPMGVDVLIASATLPGTPPRDPADRILAATARLHGHLLLTRDGELLPYSTAGHLAATQA